MASHARHGHRMRMGAFEPGEQAALQVTSGVHQDPTAAFRT